jgi:uncharacterized BrkB/YihY/UPF0761 family membrane protein
VLICSFSVRGGFFGGALFFVIIFLFILCCVTLLGADLCRGLGWLLWVV